VISLLLGTSASLAGQTFDLAGWSTTAVEAVPDLSGETDLRFRQQLGLSAGLPRGWRVEADGALRYPATGDELLIDVHRLAVLAGRGRGAPRLSAGRLVKFDSRGLLPLDGLVVEGDLTPGAGAQVWLGRLWSPEGLDVDQSFVGGAAIAVHPPGRDGAPSRATTLSLSWMGTETDGRFIHSVTGAANARGPKGGSATADVELRGDAQSDPGVRGGVQAVWAATKAIRISPEVSWEGLEPAGHPVALRTPIEWLAGEGYALGGLGATITSGSFGVQLRGAGVLHDPAGDVEEGGLARIGMGFTAAEGSRLGVFGLGAGVGASLVTGGGVEAAWHPGVVHLSGEAGLFHDRPIGGPAAPIAEVRLRGGTTLFSNDGTDGLTITADLSAGSDRILAQWMRAGLVIGGALGGGANAP
jgi:hypothetical protein